MTKYSDKVRRYLVWRYGITDGGEDYMTTKDWLNRGWALDREITALRVPSAGRMTAVCPAWHRFPVHRAAAVPQTAA